MEGVVCVSPVLVKTSPITVDEKMNMTEGPIKSLKATLAGRIRYRAWSTPMARLVTPMGTTSKTHQAPANRNTANAPFKFEGLHGLKDFGKYISES